MAFKLEIKGLDVAVKKIEGLAATARVDANNALTKFGQDVARSAKTTLQRNGTSNTGQLAQSINATNSTQLKSEVTVAKNYAAYVEFGTKKFAAAYVATLPPDWRTYAATFKGKGGGTFDELVESIEQWLKDRGIGEKVKGQSKATTRKADAYAIALHIVRFGVKAQPYLYPAVTKHLPELTKRLREIFNGK